MDTFDHLGRKIRTAKDLHSIVRTMKALAAAGIRQCESATDAVRDYAGTVECGLQAVLRVHPHKPPSTPRESVPIVAVLFGTDQGMCGQFNDALVSHARRRLTLITRGDAARARRWGVGTRVAGILSDAGDGIEAVYTTPASVSHVTSIVQQLALDLDAWGTQHGRYELWLFHHVAQAGAGYGPVDRRVVPADPIWLHELGHRRWSTSQMPMCGGDGHDVYSALVQQYLFVSLHRAMLESMLSENIARLAAMQAAERNIEEMCSALQFEYQQSRQSAITGELLEIVSGFEAMTKRAVPPMLSR
jgi:F-type H+-transporting ATPase subunit gamma